jgi:Calx-beta domain
MQAPRSLRPLLALFSAAFVLLALTVRAGDPVNPILFVTQVPMPEEVNARSITQSYMSCVSPFGNHLGGTAFAGRGGSLWVRFGPNAVPARNHELVNLLAVADWSAVAGGKPAANAVAVRNPAVHWQGHRAVFAMVIGAPTGPADTTDFKWQLYEITLPTQAQLAASVKPVITPVANQPAYNNITPAYAPDDQLLFASDRPYDGQPHLTQREEYLGLPTVSGIWKLNPVTGAIHLLHHAPSGAFSPIVDSYGRVIFISWDHLSRDVEAVTDERDSDTTYGENAPDVWSGWHRTLNGSGNFADESAGAAFTPGSLYGQAPHLDVFPEPRNVDKRTLRTEAPWAATVNGSLTNVINGVTTNIFMPWMINLDGTGGEILNHAGRQELGLGLKRSFIGPADGDLVDLNPFVDAGYGGLVAHNVFANFFSVREDPNQPGTYYGIDSVDLGTHASGRIIKLVNAGDGANPDQMQVVYVTALAANLPIVQLGMAITSPPSPFPPIATPQTLYRTAVPLKDGNLVASMATGLDRTDYNKGTLTQPQSWFNFRLTSFKSVAGSPDLVPDLPLTSGLTITSSYYVPGQAQPVTFTNVAAWELDPAEVVVTPLPASVTTATVDLIEAAAFATAQVHLPTFQSWLTANNYALSISRDVRFRDRHDRQQPFNLRNSWSGQQIVATAGTVYDIAWAQFFQADLRRGYTLGGATPVPGRRVVATPMHRGFSENVPAPGAPPGSVRLGDDSSFAAIVPAGQALTWHLLNNDPALTSQVKERFWVTFQPGEIRTCANCHGINTANQIGTGKPVNTPQALLDLLGRWKTNHPAGTLAPASPLVTFLKSVATADIVVKRTGGSTGPASVAFATQNGSALAGTDFTATSGTLAWADGDSAPRTVSVPLLHPPGPGPAKTFSVTLSAPTYATLGASGANVTLTETPLDAYLFAHFGAGANQPGGGLPADDPDGDGKTNAEEFITGTTPTDPTSVFTAALVVAPADGQLHLAFQAMPGVGYTIQRKAALTDATWQHHADVPATPSGQSIDLALPPPSGASVFYRVVTPIQP